MNNPALRQSLAEIEKSLSKIDSARNQVISVSEQSKLLIQEIKKAAEGISNFNSTIENEFDVLVNGVDDKISKLDSSLDGFADLSSKNINQVESKFNDLAKAIESNIVEANNSFSGFSKEVSDAQKRIEDFDLAGQFEGIKEVFVSLKDDLLNEVASFKDVQERLNNEQKQEFNTVFHSNMDALYSRIGELKKDLSLKVEESGGKLEKSLSEKIEKLSLEMNAKMNRNFFILGAGIAAVGLIVVILRLI